MALAPKVNLFVRTAGAWSQEEYLKALNAGTFDFFASALALSSDGGTLAIGAPFEDGSAIEMSSNQGEDAGEDAGAVYTHVIEW